MKKLIFTLFLLTFVAISLNARPQYSILQTYGTKCNGCHENTQGGGFRSAPGFLSRKDMSVINPSWIGLKGVFDAMSSNTVLNDVVMFGLDFRYQTAKWKYPGVTERRFMVMQATPYLAIKPFEWLEFEGYYNAGYDLEEKMRYPGQQRAGGSMYIKPAEGMPTLRVGYFQPTIGQKWDDHTMLIRQAPGKEGRKPVIADDYQEWGAQVDYEALPWLGLSAGVFQAENLASTMYKFAVKKDLNKFDYKNVVDSGSYSTVLRASFHPELPMGLTAYGGGTMMFNGDYLITNVFGSLGISETFSICAEYLRSEKKDSRLTMAYLFDVTYQLSESVLPFARLERSIVKEADDRGLPAYTNQYVFGAHINILPFIDLLPEYRIYDREHVDGYSAQWAFQIHVFY
jgi:hypothetical protein